MPSAASETQDPSIAYRQSFADVLEALGSDPQRGLTGDEARRRLERHGRNELTGEQPVPSWRRFAAQFQDVLVILLLVATAISTGLWLIERDASLPYEAVAIFAVVLLNAAMGYVQEARAEGHVVRPRALQRRDAPHHPRGVTLEGGTQRLRELAESELGSADHRRYFFLPPASRS